MFKSLAICSLISVSVLAQKTNYITQLTNKPFGDPREFVWTRTVGSGLTGSLSSAGNNTLTFTNCPYGIMGNAEDMWVRIYSGSGTEEAAKIIGGTCTGTGPSGTLIINTANAHTGSWKIGTAYAGMREAQNLLTSKWVHVIPGTYNWYAPFYPRDGSGLICGAANADGSPTPTCFVSFKHNSLAAVVGITNDFVIKGFAFQHDAAAGTPTSTNHGIVTTTIGGKKAFGYRLEDLSFRGFGGNGVDLEGGSLGYLNNVQSTNNEGDCFVSRQAQGYWFNVTGIGCKGDSFKLTAASGPAGTNPFITNLHSFSSGGWGVNILHSNVYIQGCYLNNESLGNMRVAASAIGSDNHLISNCIMEWAGDNSFAPATGYTKNLTAPSLKLETGGGGIQFSNISIMGPNGNGIELAGSEFSFSNLKVYSQGRGAQPNFLYSILQTAGANNKFSNVVGSAVKITGGGGTILTNSSFAHDSATISPLEITAGTHFMIANNFFSQAGTAPAFKVATGVTLLEGHNLISGTVDNKGLEEATSKPTVPQKILALTHAQVMALVNPTQGDIYICVGCTVGSNPCTAGGNNVLAVFIAPSFSCQSATF